MYGYGTVTSSEFNAHKWLSGYDSSDASSYRILYAGSYSLLL